MTDTLRQAAEARQAALDAAEDTYQRRRRELWQLHRDDEQAYATAHLEAHRAYVAACDEAQRRYAEASGG